jgi:Sigma-70, region 4/Homeodomain-like domain
VDVKRAADLYALGWTLRQIAAELGVTATTVSEQLRRAGVTMRRGGASAHPASTQQILELRDQGRTWPEIAEQVDMTVSSAWSRYRRARPPKSPRLGRWQRVLADALDQNLAIGVQQRSLIISIEPPPGLSLLPHDEQPMVSPPSVVPACCTCRVPMRTPTPATATIWCWRSRM